MKKKIVSLCLVVALLAIAIVGGTFAYLQDTDSDVNVMTSGKADIVQNEQERVLETVEVKDAQGNVVGYDVKYAEPVDGKVSLQDFTDNKLLVPAVHYNADGSVSGDLYAFPDTSWGLVSYDGADGATHNLLSDSIMNEVDKIITVTNNGSVPVYVRTIVLFEAPDYENFEKYINHAWDASANIAGAENSGVYNFVKDADGNVATITIGGVSYVATVHYYEKELAAGATTAPSLKQIAMKPAATNDIVDLMLGTDLKYNILALSQAVQADGFNDDAVALNAAFGEVTADNVVTWWAEVNG